MSRLATICLLILAAAAAAFLLFVEPHLGRTRDAVQMGGSVFQFEVDSVNSITIRTGDQVIEFKRKEDSWWLGPQPKDRADATAVTRLLSLAQNLQVLDVIKASELKGDLDLKDYGLKKPKSQLELRGDTLMQLFIGKEAVGEGRVFVRTADSGDVYVVSDELQRLMARNAQDFRDLRLTDLDPDEIDGFTLRRASGEIEIRHGPRGWDIVKPLKAAADTSKVNAFLSPLLGMQILEFVGDDKGETGKYGLTEPRAELVIDVTGQDRPHVLRIGADTQAGTADAVFAQFTARDSIYKLPARVLARLQVGPDEFRDRHLLKLNLDTVDRITINRGSDEAKLARSGEGWELKASGQQLVLDDRIVRTAVEDLCHLKVERFVPASAGALAENGLEPPIIMMQFDAWLSENTPEATAGRQPVASITIGKQEASSVFARVGEAGEILLIPAIAQELLPATFDGWKKLEARSEEPPPAIPAEP